MASFQPRRNAHETEVPVAVLAAFACAAGAQTMKPGLWEVTQTMQSTDARTQQSSRAAEQQSVSQMQQMANMPAEQRKMVEEMMARQGVKMGPAGAVRPRH